MNRKHLPKKVFILKTINIKSVSVPILALATDLIRKGIDVNKQNIEGFTPLHYAVEKDARPLVKSLLEMGANPNIINRHGNNALWVGVFNAKGSYETVKLLMKYNSDPYHKNKYGRSPLDFAIQIGDTYMQQILTQTKTYE